MSRISEERVLVIPTDVFREAGYFQGFCRDVERYVPLLFQPRHFSFRPRREVEHDASFKQLIPYVVLAHDAGSSVRVFHYTRGKGQGESRLHLKRSIGIGGHIAQIDASTATGSAFEEGMQRELLEEVTIGTPFTLTPVGLINDDETDVGRVHLGVVCLARLEEPLVHAREADILNCGFASPHELRNNWDDLESWSQLALAHLF
ncbi:MAG: phosphoesterase [Thermogutta sp.]|nr:phosphoesterase [Thermogutta sp.]